VLTKEIANASVEQTEGIGQVSKAVQQMDQITQQNAANAEETASASEEMSAQAQNMKEEISILAAQVGGSKVDVQLDTHKKPPVRNRQIVHKQYDKSTTKVKGNNHGTTEPEALIPMGENRIIEHDEKLKDF
jgi:methyl-accepting chemotaxis protein